MTKWIGSDRGGPARPVRDDWASKIMSFCVLNFGLITVESFVCQACVTEILKNDSSDFGSGRCRIFGNRISIFKFQSHFRPPLVSTVSRDTVLNRRIIFQNQTRSYTLLTCDCCGRLEESEGVGVVVGGSGSRREWEL